MSTGDWTALIAALAALTGAVNNRWAFLALMVMLVAMLAVWMYTGGLAAL